MKEALNMIGEEFSMHYSPLTINHLKELGCLGHFSKLDPLPRYINVPGLFGRQDIEHYLWDLYRGFGQDHGRKIQPAISSLPFQNLTHFGRETCV